MSEIRPRVLVLMATYNGADWLPEQLTSILNQKDVDLTVQVRDDASSDRTCEIIRDVAAAAPLSLSAASSGSGSAGSNFRSLMKEADASDFDYIALADQDDIWLSDKLIRAIDSLKRNGAEGYSSAVEAFWPNGHTAAIVQSPATTRADFLFEGAGQGCTFVLTQYLFQKVRTFLVSNSEDCERLHYHDWLIYLVARANGMSWIFDPRPSMRYRQHGGNEIGARGGFTAVKRRLALIRNGWYLRQIQAAARLYCLLGAREKVAQAIAERFSQVTPPDAFLGQVRLAYLISRYGRRRVSDRAVLVFAAFARWI